MKLKAIIFIISSSFLVTALYSCQIPVVVISDAINDESCDGDHMEISPLVPHQIIHNGEHEQKAIYELFPAATTLFVRPIFSSSSSENLSSDPMINQSEPIHLETKEESGYNLRHKKLCFKKYCVCCSRDKHSPTNDHDLRFHKETSH